MGYRVLIAPRWGGRPSDDFYPWLGDRIAAGAVPGADHAVVLDLPDPGSPDVGTWSRAVAGRIEEAPEQTVVLGHSVGAQAALRALALLGDGVRAAAVLVVAGWQTVDEPWPTIRPWIDTPIDTARARRAVRQIRALLSDDDPFTSDHRATAAWLRDALGATVALAPGGRHFNGAHEHAVEDALVSLLADLG